MEVIASRPVESWDCTLEVGSGSVGDGGRFIRVRWPNKRGGFNQAASAEFPVELLPNIHLLRHR